MNSGYDLSDNPLSGDANNDLSRNDVLPGSIQQGYIEGKILIVEDEPELAMMLEHFLCGKGFIAAIAGDGLTACRMINAFRPDLILLDIKLPELDGWEVCRLVRKIPDRNLANTPIMMLSALVTEQDRAQGLKLGADDYMTKPYSLKEVEVRANKLIHRYRTGSTEDRI